MATPLRGKVKINWDAAFKKSHQTMGIGAVVLDYQGKIMASLCSSQPIPSHPIVAEYKALRRAMFFCMELSFSTAQFKGDLTFRLCYKQRNRL